MGCAQNLRFRVARLTRKPSPFRPVISPSAIVFAVILLFAGQNPSLFAETSCSSVLALLVAINPQNPSTVYFGTHRELFVSHDRGETWDHAMPPDLAVGVSSIALSASSPQRIYAGTSIGTLIRSLDGGKTWDAAGRGLTIPNCPDAFPCAITLGIDAVAIDPANPSRVLLGSNVGLFEWTEGDRAWSPIQGPLRNEGITALLFDSTEPQRVYAGTGSGVFRSLDRGRTWTSSLLTDDVNTLAIDPARPSRIYAGTLAGIYRTDDQGQTWSSMSNGLPTDHGAVASIIVDPATPATLIAATFFGQIYESDNSGQNWTRLPGFLPDANSLALDPGEPRVLYATSVVDPGLRKSSDAGVSWAPSFGLGASPKIYGISPSSVLAGARDFPLLTLGTGIRKGDMLYVNGVPRGMASVDSCSQIDAWVRSSDVAVPGSVLITVVRPEPLGAVSNTVVLKVEPTDSLRKQRVDRTRQVRKIEPD